MVGFASGILVGSLVATFCYFLKKYVRKTGSSIEQNISVNSSIHGNEEEVLPNTLLKNSEKEAVVKSNIRSLL